MGFWSLGLRVHLAASPSVGYGWNMAESKMVTKAQNKGRTPGSLIQVRDRP
jgi:hypothetical protein